MSDYLSFIQSKAKAAAFNPIREWHIPDKCFDYQKSIIRWALRKGRACIFAGTGLGKTIMELVWANNIAAGENAGNVLILAPLAVSDQIVQEGKAFGIPVEKVADAEDVVGRGIFVTNYAKLHKFTGLHWGGIVLDESSIIKNHNGATKAALIEFAQGIEYRLASTATPAPNDWMELASHAEFLGVCSRAEMLATYFVHDGGETQKWRLKGHAQESFWKWVCSWATLLKSPADIGFDGSSHELPELQTFQASVKTNQVLPGELFTTEAQTLQERVKAKRATVDSRVAKAAEIVASEPSCHWVVWCHLNSESSALADAIPGSVEIRGDQDDETKERILREFAAGQIRVLIGKPSMCGFGLNWQHCRRQVFVGLNDSWEQVYQAVRRCWRFGQKMPVHVWFVAADVEGNVVANIARKEKQAEEMSQQMIEQTSVHVRDELKEKRTLKLDYKTGEERGDNWKMLMGDCVSHVSAMDSASIDFSIYSPPFASLYTYSASDHDMGNCRNDEEFLQHYRYLVAEMYRVTKPGRLTAFHCMLLPSSKSHHGEIGLRDFRGELIRIHQECGWIYHSEVCIWKDPVTAMQRTKAIGLLWKQLKKDSTISRQGIPDYLVVCRKPGVNTSPVSHTPQDFPVSEWQKIASPVWMDINPSDTLQRTSAREDQDERHICPLQLEVIRRGLRLWSNPGDLVLSPFAGIGSEGFVSLQMGRRFVGVELKESYFRQACANLKNATSESATLFDFEEVAQ
jgi:hypothetical protein